MYIHFHAEQVNTMCRTEVIQTLVLTAHIISSK